MNNHISKLPNEISVEFQSILKEFNVSYTVASRMELLLIKSYNAGVSSLPVK